MIRPYRLVVFAGCSILLACPRPQVTRPANAAATRAFGICSASEPAPGPLPTVEFRLDDSLSMAGYVTEASAYRTVLHRVIEGAVQAGYPSSIRGFTSPAAVPLDSIGAVMQPKYYSAKDTRLGAVLDDISAPPPKGAHEKIVVLVSDLIQDEQARDSLAISAALRKVAEHFPNIILYGFRSAFHGTYYVTSPPRGKVIVDTVDGIGRPFYLLILAPSSHALRQFEQFAGLYELLNDKTLGGQTFEASVAPIAVDSVRLRTNPDPDKNDWTGYEAPSDWRCGDGQRVQFHSLRAMPSAATAGDVRLTFNVHATALLPMVVPTRYQAEIRRLAPDGATATPAGDVTMTTEGDLANPSCTLSYRFPLPRQGHWDVYSVRVRPGDANLARPKWITDWSTDDDSRDTGRDRTLNLSVFGDALVRAVAERTVFLDHVIELYRGE